MITQQFFDTLDLLGYSIEYADLSNAERLGECDTVNKIVTLHHDLSPRELPYILGHETWHALNNDVPTMFGQFDARMERRADEWSALMCIDLDAFREYELQFSGHVPTMAFNLGVPDEAVEMLKSMLNRIGNELYMLPKMGYGQWLMKVSA